MIHPRPFALTLLMVIHASAVSQFCSSAFDSTVCVGGGTGVDGWLRTEELCSNKPIEVYEVETNNFKKADSSCRLSEKGKFRGGIPLPTQPISTNLCFRSGGTGDDGWGW
jgi:hypothetical protein